MKDKELRKVIGVRAKQRRLELGVSQPYATREAKRDSAKLLDKVVGMS